MKLLLFAVVFCLAVTGKAQECRCQALANAGNCDFYTQCVEPRFHCGINGYPLAYGYRYCHHFRNNQSCFTSAVSNEWFLQFISLLSYRVKSWLIK